MNISLRKMRDTDLATINFLEDIRGNQVVDSQDRAVGEVTQLYLDDQHRKIRCFGIPAHQDAEMILVPIDLIARISRGVVYLDRADDQFAVVPLPDHFLTDQQKVEALYKHYSLSPFWVAEYEYPPYPFYPNIIR